MPVDGNMNEQMKDNLMNKLETESKVLTEAQLPEHFNWEMVKQILQGLSSVLYLVKNTFPPGLIREMLAGIVGLMSLITTFLPINEVPANTATA